MSDVFPNNTWDTATTLGVVGFQSTAEVDGVITGLFKIDSLDKSGSYDGDWIDYFSITPYQLYSYDIAVSMSPPENGISWAVVTGDTFSTEYAFLYSGQTMSDEAQEEFDYVTSFLISSYGEENVFINEGWSERGEINVSPSDYVLGKSFFSIEAKTYTYSETETGWPEKEYIETQYNFTLGPKSGYRVEPDGSEVTVEFKFTFGSDDDDAIALAGDDDYLSGGAGNDWLHAGEGYNIIHGGDGDDTLIGGGKPDVLSGDSGRDLLIGGPGDDLYYVDDTFDIVDEGILFPEFGHGGTDTIISSANWFWDVYSVGEIGRIAEDASDPDGTGVTYVGGIFDNVLYGHSSTDILFGRGGNDTYRAGDGVDWISLSTLGLTDKNAYAGVDGQNTIIVDPRSTGKFSYDIIFEFDPGKDKVDVSAYGSQYASGADVLSHAVDDGAGSSYIALGDGLDYLYFVGLSKAELLAGDFVV